MRRVCMGQQQILTELFRACSVENLQNDMAALERVSNMQAQRVEAHSRQHQEPFGMNLQW
jgi:hypothetical protein